MQITPSIAVYIFASILFFINSFRSIFFWTFIWQSGDYTLAGAFFITLQSYRKNLIQLFFSILFILVIGLYIVIVFHDEFTQWYQLGVVGVFFFRAILTAQEIKAKHFILPIFTIRSGTIICLTLFFFSLLFITPLVDSYLWLLLMTLAIPIMIAIFVSLFAFPAEIYTDILLQKAKNKIKRHKDIYIIFVCGNNNTDLIVIMLTNLLQKRFLTVASSPGYTTPLRVAQTILKKVTENVDVIIIEMNSQRVDTIEKINKLIHPNCIIFTGFYNSSHIIQRRTTENFIKTFIQNGRKRSMFLVDNDISQIQELSKKKIISYAFLEDKKVIVPTLSAHLIKEKKIIVKFKNKKYTYKVPSIRKEFIASLTPSLFIAEYFGLSHLDIQEGVQNLRKKQHIRQNNDRK